MVVALLPFFAVLLLKELVFFRFQTTEDCTSFYECNDKNKLKVPGFSITTKPLGALIGQ